MSMGNQFREALFSKAHRSCWPGGSCPGGLVLREIGGGLVRGLLPGGSCPGGTCPGGKCPTLVHTVQLAKAYVSAVYGRSGRPASVCLFC